VVCEDESIFTYDSILRCVWAKRRSEPFVLTTGSHRHSCLFGAMSIDGRQLFRQRSSIDGENFLAYLREMKRKFAPMLLFLDRSGPHHRDEEVRKFLMENSDCIKVIWFPRARPELNPVEECWNLLKKELLANKIKIYPTFGEMRIDIAQRIRTKRFRLNIVDYLY
jgi:transposase